MPPIPSTPYPASRIPPPPNYTKAQSNSQKQAPAFPAPLRAAASNISIRPAGSSWRSLYAPFRAARVNRGAALSAQRLFTTSAVLSPRRAHLNPNPAPGITFASVLHEPSPIPPCALPQHHVPTPTFDHDETLTGTSNSRKSSRQAALLECHLSRNLLARSRTPHLENFVLALRKPSRLTPRIPTKPASVNIRPTN